MISAILNRYKRRLELPETATTEELLLAMRNDSVLSNRESLLSVNSGNRMKRNLLGLIEADIRNLLKFEKATLKEQEHSIREKSKDLEAMMASIENQNEFYDKIVGLNFPKTLPIEEQTNLPVKELQVGSSTTAYTNTSYSYLDNNNMNSGDTFFFESLEEEECEAEIVFMFKEEQIANGLYLELFEDEIVRQAKVKAVKHNETLLPFIWDKENNIVHFEAVVTKLVSVVLEQLDVSEYNSMRRKVIGVKVVRPLSIKYESKVEFDFKKITSGFSAYQIISSISKHSKLDTFIFGGETSSKAGTFPVGTVVGDPNLSLIEGKIVGQRNDEQLGGLSFRSGDNLAFLSATAYKDNGIASLATKKRNALPPKAYETNLLWRHNKKTITIGTGIGAAIALEPFIPIRNEDVAMLKVYVAGTEWPRVNDVEDMVTEEMGWEWSKGRIKFGSIAYPALNAKIEVRLEPENVSIRRDILNNKYVLEPIYDYDPDTNAMNLFEVSDQAADNKTMVPLNSLVIKLQPNIVSGSIKLRQTDENDNPISLLTTEVAFENGKKELTTEESYSIDYENGYLYLAETIKGAHKVLVSYHYYPIKDCRDFLRFDPDTNELIIGKVKAKQVTDFIGSNPFELGISGKTFLTQESSTVQSSSFLLSNSGVLEGTVDAINMFLDTSLPLIEVPYYNGHWELKGISQVTETTETFRGTGTKSFSLASHSRLYGTNANDFSFEMADYFTNWRDDHNLVSAKGDYHIDFTNGIIYFYNDLSRMKAFKYSYLIISNVNRNSNVFSVDYKRGTFNTLHELLDTSSTSSLTYKAANYKLCYQIVNNLPVSSYNDNETFIDTALLIKNKSNVKVMQIEASSEEFLEEYKYYTPFIRNVSLGLN